MKTRTGFIVLLLAAALSAGCASGPATRAMGDASASVQTGDITTTTTTTSDGTVTVVQVCTGCNVDESVGGKGGDRMYEAVVDIILGFVSVASLLFQVL